MFLAVSYRVRDILQHWRAQDAITSDQLRAGQHFLRLYDATIDGGATIDPTRVRVDGGRGPAAAAERSAIALSEMRELECLVGRFDFALLCRIVGRGADLKLDTPSETDRKYLSRRVRDALGMIAARDRIVAPGA